MTEGHQSTFEAGSRKRTSLKYSKQLMFQLKFAIASMCAVLGLQLHAAEEWAFFDWDGTIVEHRQSQGGTYSTPHVLFRVNERGLQIIAKPIPGPQVLEVTHQEFERMESFLAHGQGALGATVNREVKLSSGLTVQPAFYFIKLPDTFSYFRESTEPNRNYLLEQFKAAFEASPQGAWKGRLFDTFATWCSTPESASRTLIDTARGHSKKEWDELFDFMIAKGLIKFKPRVANLSRQEFDIYGPPSDMAMRKKNFLTTQLAALDRFPAKPEEPHRIIIADDDASNHKAKWDVAQAFALRGKTPVVLVVVNVGLKTQIRESEYPEVGIIKTSRNYRGGTFADALPSFARAQTLAPQISIPLTCESSFGVKK